MKGKDIVGALMAIFGGVLALRGFLTMETTLINLGIAGMLLGGVVITFKSSECTKRDSVKLILEAYEDALRRMCENLYLEGNAIFIPPYENLPKGGLFVPLHRDFELDLARFDEKIVFLTDVPKDSAMGLFLGPFGGELVDKFEEHLEGPLEGVGSVESAGGAVLKALGLASRVYIEESRDYYMVIVKPEVECDHDNLTKVPCPIISAILLGLSKATGELLTIEGAEEKEHGIELRVKKLGGAEEWM